MAFYIYVSTSVMIVSQNTGAHTTGILEHVDIYALRERERERESERDRERETPAFWNAGKQIKEFWIGQKTGNCASLQTFSISNSTKLYCINL